MLLIWSLLSFYSLFMKPHYYTFQVFHIFLVIQLFSPSCIILMTQYSVLFVLSSCSYVLIFKIFNFLVIRYICNIKSPKRLDLMCWIHIFRMVREFKTGSKIFHFLQDKNHLTTQKGNKSKLITFINCIIEFFNGLVKRWKPLGRTIPNRQILIKILLKKSISTMQQMIVW